jgi:uncharacterized protein YqgQ
MDMMDSFTVSDLALKKDVEYLEHREVLVAVKLKDLLKKFKYKNDIKDKIHIGVIAQEVEELFHKEGLNAHDYALLSKITYFDGGQEKEYLAVNYNQLLAFLITVL